MDDQRLEEDAHSEFLTLTYSDEALASNSRQLSEECRNIILESNNCEPVGTITPLNDLLLGQTFIIETNDQQLFIDGTQLVTFQHIDSNRQIDDLQEISTIDSNKPTFQSISYAVNSSDQFQDLYTDFHKTNSDIPKISGDCQSLIEHLEVLNCSDIDLTRGNYSNSTAIKILDDVASSPVDINGHFVCDLCLCEFDNWQNYKKHKLEHLNDKPFKCLKCLKSFNYNNNYLLHIATHLTNNLKCPQCKKEFKRLASFKSHLKIHKTEESITCNICDQIFDNQYRLDIHKEQCMQDNLINPYNLGDEPSVSIITTCKTCKKSFPTISEYKIHIKEHQIFDSVLKKQHKYSMKLKKKHKSAILVKKFKCDRCDWSFSKSNLLHRHMRTHTGEKPFECSYCSRYFTQQNSLNRHLLKHQGLRPFKCELCEMSFSQKGHLINHMKRCHAVIKEATRIHKCSMCSCVYNSLNALNKHLNNYHRLKNNNLNKNVRNLVQKVVETDDINETLNLIKDSSKLDRWLEEVAHELQSSDNNSELKHQNVTVSSQCELELNFIGNEQYNPVNNNVNSSTNVILINHNETENLICSSQNGGSYIDFKNNQEPSLIKNDVIKNQEKDFVTMDDESISLSFMENTDKISSKIIKTSNKIDAETTIIKRKSARLSNLKKKRLLSTKASNHLNITSEPKVLFEPNITSDSEDTNVNIVQKQPKVCQFCGKIFKKNADLERHERTHTGDKPYKCNKQNCNKAFATKCSLDYHTITHLGKMKRAVCPHCNGLFATTSSMKVHIRQHTGEKPFKCPVCGDAFRTSGHLHTHVIIHERKKKRK